MSSKTPCIVGEAGMTTAQESASQAGQGVESEEDSYLGEKRAHKGPVWTCGNSEGLWTRERKEIKP